jgi:hypothetical protein
LNTTSIETGRRVILSPVRMAKVLGQNRPDIPEEKKRPLFLDAYDMDQFLCSSNNISSLRWIDKIARLLPSLFSQAEGADKGCRDGKPTTIDIRLSTAASLSSRSPFVTPHANIRDGSAQVVDSVVDGGYFDNSGLVSALEIAAGLKTIDNRLQPYILQISNEPDWFKDSVACGGTGNVNDGPPIPDEIDFKPLGTLGNILTVNATRIARGYEAIVETPGRIRSLNGDLPSSAQIYVCPQPLEKFSQLFLRWNVREDVATKQESLKERSSRGWKNISLSWWLSPAFQAYLDDQIYSGNNERSHDCVLALLRDHSKGEKDKCG